ncbi:hypothetical protein [Puia dinghuensis]|uniref:Uncharacterized protein n=1 Tax=Puia dinghuensis TaxID=1792502 RepID=A0A8J2U8K9_9BACT|nr:hypothetical protein [Puia dinghuensis]GGA86807.1 hypothetical protein GCM10011511_07350 [Puia dinghuensis]
MFYPLTQPGKALFPGIVLLFFFIPVHLPGAPARNYFYSFPSDTPNLPEKTLYKRDTALEYVPSGIIRREKNGDIVITVPADALGRYKVRFFDDKDELLFEIRQIRDPLLIIEKYNFCHAGLFRYDLYRDNGLVERRSFRIGP